MPVKTIIKRSLKALGYDIRALPRYVDAPRYPALPALSRYNLVYGPDQQTCAFSFWLANRDAMQWYDEWFYAAKRPTWELDEFSKIVEPGDSVLEIGCHHGFLTMMLAHLVGPSGRILAVDALPENVMVAQAQIALNNLAPRCTAVNLACSDRPGAVDISLRTNSHVVLHNSDPHTVAVEAVTGDFLDELYGPFSVLKLDVEGFESRVLAGCRNILRRKPKLIIELHPQFMSEYGYGGSLEAVFEQIGADNYHGTMVLRPEFERSIPFHVDAVPRDRVSNLHLAPRIGGSAIVTSSGPLK